MINYYIKLALRNIFRTKKFTLLNLLGLGAGMAFVYLIAIYLVNEWSYDQQWKEADQIYRVVQISESSVGEEHVYHNPLPMSVTLNQEFSDQLVAVGIWQDIADVKVKDDIFPEQKLFNVEAAFFDMFSFEVLAGNPVKFLIDPHSAVISRSSAINLFGTENPIGKSFELRNMVYEVTGVVEDPPKNSILQFDFLLSDKLRYQVYENWDERWWHSGLYTFVKFNSEIPPGNFSQQLSVINQKYLPEYLKNRENYYIVPLSRSHITDTISYDIVQVVSPKYLLVLSIIAISILFIACFNYFSLTTSQLSKYGKLIGVKKVLGASTKHLLLGFIVEAMIVSVAASFVAIILSQFLLPTLNQLTSRQLSINLHNFIFLLIIIGIALLVGLVTGIIPALILSKFKTIDAFKSFNSPLGIQFRRAIVISQFTVVIMLIISDLMIFKQIDYMKNAQLGFDKENLLSFHVKPLADHPMDQVKKTEQFLQAIQPYTSQYQFSTPTISEFVPGFYFSNSFGVIPSGKNDEEFIVKSVAVDEQFFDVFGLKVLKGRSFNKHLSTDREKVIINETALETFGWDNPKDRFISFKHEGFEMEVIGLVNDIHINSLQHKIEPVIYRFGKHNNYPGFATIRLNDQKVQTTIQFLEGQWEALFPDIPFSYFFVGDKYEEKYAGEEKLLKIIGIFSLLGIGLACLGIFSMISFITEQRTKEIGIRKVMGASISSIVSMLNLDFLRWVMVACALAIPTGYYFMFYWLQNFAYRTTMDWWIFVAGGSMAVLLAMLTISYQTIKSALGNPVEALRYE